MKGQVIKIYEGSDKSEFRNVLVVFTTKGGIRMYGGSVFFSVHKFVEVTTDTDFMELLGGQPFKVEMQQVVDQATGDTREFRVGIIG